MIVDHPFLLLPMDTTGTEDAGEVRYEYVPVESCPEEMDKFYQIFTTINDVERGWVA
jgi:hypothetical protein